MIAANGCAMAVSLPPLPLDDHGENDDDPFQNGLVLRLDISQTEDVVENAGRRVGAPIIEPTTVPMPPARLVPPITTAAMALSS